VVVGVLVCGVNGPESAPHRDRFDAMLRDEVPSLDDHERTLIVAALCHLDSSTTWVTMRRELAMNGRDIADAAMWAAEAVLDPIRDKTAR
jgi:hypothetical protein